MISFIYIYFFITLILLYLYDKYSIKHSIIFYIEIENSNFIYQKKKKKLSKCVIPK